MWAVITGAGTGIGAALTKDLSSKGVKVLAIGRRLEPLVSVQSHNPDFITTLQADIASKEGRTAILSAIPEGEIVRFLVQNAAVGTPARVGDIDEEELRYAMDVNVVAPLALTQGFLPRLRESSGRILHVGTGVAFRPQPGTCMYGVTKMAFHRLYEQLVTELVPGVGVAMVTPGVVDTEGLWEHYNLAKELDLPHVKYFDVIKAQNKVISAQECASFLTYVLMKSDDEDYSKVWSINDETLWHLWKE